MAEGTSSPSPGGGNRSRFGFLTRKIGPVPIWLIIVALAGGYYWYEHYGPGAAKNKAASGAQAIDPQTGAAWAAELAAAEQQIADLQAEERTEQIPPPHHVKHDHDHDHDHDRDDRSTASSSAPASSFAAVAAPRPSATVAAPRTSAAPAMTTDTRWRAA